MRFNFKVSNASWQSCVHKKGVLAGQFDKRGCDICVLADEPSVPACSSEKRLNFPYGRWRWYSFDCIDLVRSGADSLFADAMPAKAHFAHGKLAFRWFDSEAMGQEVLKRESQAF